VAKVFNIATGWPQTLPVIVTTVGTSALLQKLALVPITSSVTCICAVMWQ